MNGGGDGRRIEPLIITKVLSLFRFARHIALHSAIARARVERPEKKFVISTFL